MTVMRRSPIALLFFVGLGVLVGATVVGGTSGAATVVAAPFIVLGFIFKIMLAVFLFGLLARMFGGHRGGQNHHGHRGKGGPWSAEAKENWQRRHESADGTQQSGPSDRFEEWHRLAHAREEVDEHVPPVEA